MSSKEDQDRQERLRHAGLSVDQLSASTHNITVEQQKRLSAAGLYVSEGHRYFADGKAGALTEHGLKLESEKGYAEKFLTQAVAQDGQRSPADIIKLQTALNKMGYDAGKVDGLDGKNTQAALQRFLHDHPKLIQQQPDAPATVPRHDRAAGLGEGAKHLSTRKEFGSNVLPGISHRPGQEVIYIGDSRADGVYHADRASNKTDGAVVGAFLMNQTGEVRGAIAHGLSRVSSGDKVLISWGTNDFKNFVDANGNINEKKRDAFVEKYRDMIQDVKARGGEPVVLGFSATGYHGMSQKQVDFLNGEGNRMLRDIARTEGAGFTQALKEDVAGPREIHNSARANRTFADALHRPNA